jgi:hypothetical protein
MPENQAADGAPTANGKQRDLSGQTASTTLWSALLGMPFFGDAAMRRLMLACALFCGGCMFDRPREPAIPRDPVRVSRSSAIEQANVEACTRVYGLGLRLLVSNPELPQALVFRAAGAPQPEVFHQGNSSIVVTQKLCEMCKSDGELAAVLSLELGKMIAEREALAPLEAREPQPRPPVDPVTFRTTSGMANPDEFRLNELALYEEDQRRHAGKPYLPDPRELARKYLFRAGFNPDELDRVKPILRAAAEHGELESQLQSTPKLTSFTPPGGP